MKINGKITFLFNHDGATIELYDEEAGITFLKVELTSEQVATAFSRLAHTKCQNIEVFGLDKIGKKMEYKPLIFEVPEDLAYHPKERDKILIPLLNKACPKGWEASNYFNSKDSFLNKDRKYYARTIIRRWVKK